MVVRVARHGGGCHGTKLVGVVVRVHGSQIGATVHPTEVGAGGGWVSLAVAGCLVVRHGVRSGGGGRTGHGTLHARGVGWGSWLGEGSHGGGGGVARGDGGAPDR